MKIDCEVAQEGFDMGFDPTGSFSIYTSFHRPRRKMNASLARPHELAACRDMGRGYKFGLRYQVFYGNGNDILLRTWGPDFRTRRAANGYCRRFNRTLRKYNP